MFVKRLFQQLKCIVFQRSIAETIVVLNLPLGIPHECVHRISNLILNTDKSGDIDHHGSVGLLMAAQVTYCIRNEKRSDCLKETGWECAHDRAVFVLDGQILFTVIIGLQQVCVWSILLENISRTDIVGRRLQCVNEISGEQVTLQHLSLRVWINKDIGIRRCCEAHIVCLYKQAKQLANRRVNCRGIASISGVDRGIVCLIVYEQHRQVNRFCCVTSIVETKPLLQLFQYALVSFSKRR